MREVFVEWFLKHAGNKKIRLITGDLGFGVLDRVISDFPHQFLNLGVAEQSMLGIAAGMSTNSQKIFVYSIGNFPSFRCLEQIRNDVCYMGANVAIISVGAGFSYGAQGYSHHAVEDVSAMRALPNISIYNPGSEREVVYSLDQINKSVGPSYIRIAKEGYHLPDQDAIPINSWVELTPPGKEWTGGFIIFSGAIGIEVLKTVNALNSGGIFPRIISVPRISPSGLTLDVAKQICSSFFLTVEEHTNKGGFGSAILEEIANLQLTIRGRFKLMGIQSGLESSLGSVDYLRKVNKISADNIFREFIELESRSRS